MFLGIGVSVREEDLVVGEGDIPVDVRTEFDIEVHRFLSWITRLTRTLLIDTSEVY